MFLSFKCANAHRRNDQNLSKLRRTTEKLFQYQHDPSGNVINLSKSSFSINVYRLLNKNLNFVPTGKIYNKIQLKYDFNNFFRRIKLKRHFIDNKQANDLNELKIKKRSTWTPKENHHSIETFIKAVNKNIESVIRGNPIKSKSNLEKRERERCS